MTATALRQATTTRRPARQPKPAPDTLVQVRCIHMHAGRYRALSSDGRTWYSQDVRARTCSCPSGAHDFAGVTAHGGICKHLVAARTFARMLASMPPAARESALRLQGVRIHVDRIDTTALDRPIGQVAAAANPHRGSAAGLLDAFGVN